MDGTTTGIWIMCAVIVVALAVWLSAVALAARRSGRKNPHVQPMRGLVQGGTHVGSGRSGMPDPRAEVPEGGGTAPAPQDMPQGGEPLARRGSGSPMDL